MQSSETLRIADQLRRAFEGHAWHGPALRELLAGIDARQAASRQVPSAHTIWELTRHIATDVKVAFEATTEGKPIPAQYDAGVDWPRITDSSAGAWAQAVSGLFTEAARLTSAIEQFPDARLAETVPGREYDFYRLFHGVVQHSLYHGGQIAILKGALTPAG